MPFPRKVQTHCRTVKARIHDALGVVVALLLVGGLVLGFVKRAFLLPLLVYEVFALTTVAHLLQRLRTELGAVQVDADGLALRPLTGAPRRLPWFAIAEATLESHDTVRLELSDGTTPLLRFLDRPLELAA